jgi:hypothetical protein
MPRSEADDHATSLEAGRRSNSRSRCACSGIDRQRQFQEREVEAPLENRTGRGVARVPRRYLLILRR